MCKESAKSPLTIWRWGRLFVTGARKLALEFDAANFIKTQRNLKIFMNSLTTSTDKIFYEYHQSNTLLVKPEEAKPHARPPNLISTKATDHLKYKASIDQYLSDAMCSDAVTSKSLNLLKQIYTLRQAAQNASLNLPTKNSSNLENEIVNGKNL